MNKHRFIIGIILLAIVSSLAVAACAEDGNTYTVAKDGVTYVIEQSSSSTFARNADPELSLSFEILSDKQTELAANPIIATDTSFENTINISNASYNGDTLCVNLAVETVPETIYVRTPLVAVKEDSNIVINDVSRFETENCYNEQLETYLTIISFDATDIAIMPDSAILKYNDFEMEALFTELYYNEDGNCMGGALCFINPANYELNNNYTLTITETHKIAESEIVSINVD